MAKKLDIPSMVPIEYVDEVKNWTTEQLILSILLVILSKLTELIEDDIEPVDTAIAELSHAGLLALAKLESIQK